MSLDAETSGAKIEGSQQDPGGSTIAGDNLRDALAETLDVPEPARNIVQAEGVATVEPGEETANHAWLFAPDKEPHEVELEDLPALVKDDRNFVWVDLSGYTEQDLCGVADLLELHRIGVRVSSSAWQRPRVDLMSDQFFATATVPRVDPGAYEVLASELDLFVGENFLVSAHKLPLPFAGRALTRAGHSPELFTLDSAYMLYVILDGLLEYYEGLAEHLQEEVERMEEAALTDTSDAFLGHLLHFKRYAFALDRLLQQHRALFEAFLRPDFPFASGEDLQSYFRDLQDHFSRLVDTLSAAKDAVNGAFDIYVSHMSHRTNQVMKVLTLATVLLLPATIVIALFSTNIRGIPVSWPWSYLLMLFLVVGISGMALLAFRRSGWLN